MYKIATSIILLLLFSLPRQSLFCEEPATFDILCVYKIEQIRHMSAIAVDSKSYGEKADTARCYALSDKAPYLYYLELPLPHTPISTEGNIKPVVVRTIDGAKDLEGLAIEPNKKAVWICAENLPGTYSKIFYVPLEPKKKIKVFKIDSIFNKLNNAAEAIACVPQKEGYELLVGQERYIPPLSIPPIFRYSIVNGRPKYIGSFRLNMPLHRTQSDMCWDPYRLRLWIISRELRVLFAVAPDSLGKSMAEADRISFSYDWDNYLNNKTAFGMAEGISVDPDGYLYVAFDNNDEKIGTDTTKLSSESRLLVLKPK